MILVTKNLCMCVCCPHTNRAVRTCLFISSELLAFAPIVTRINHDRSHVVVVVDDVVVVIVVIVDETRQRRRSRLINSTRAIPGTLLCIC